MTSDTEQKFLEEFTTLNSEWWNETQNPEVEKVKDQLILKFGSKNKAIEETFFLLWRGFLLAVSKLPKN